MASSLPERERGSKTSVKFLVSKSSKKVLYAEAREDFMDFLLSFLTFPVGSIAKLLRGKSSFGCIDNLYSSVEELSASGHTTSKDIKTMLLCPKLAPYFGCSKPVVRDGGSTAMEPFDYKVLHLLHGSEGPGAYGHCSHGLGRTQLLAMNPKFPDAVTQSGGGFVKREAMFMVTDELTMIPHSPIAIVQLINEFDLDVSDLEEQVVRFGKEEALTLMKAFLLCRTPFSNFISHRNEKVKMKAVAAYILSGFCSNSRPTTNTLNTILKTVGNEEDDDKLEKLVAEFEEKGIKDFISSLKETFSPAPSSDRNVNISAADSLRDTGTDTSKNPKRRRTNYRG
ncbi:hypothetical protein H6P81_013145 [Aristolochia fimbriata]|uniref:Uncharacterized protein n=1 Tax=Aristolochia fimbriata TaxID=158543 RepID=A0AAV7EH38_ARIFI|nr:hypothetical protein H6P81_013145 [Aristolochia fimbriata]